MITTSDTFAIETGSKTRYAGAAIYSKPRVYADTETVLVDVDIIDDSALVDGGILGSVLLEFEYADLTAFTASGANDVLKFYNLVEQAVDDYLENLPQNSSATFTIV